MTVYELIQNLSKYHPDTPVIIGKGLLLKSDLVVGDKVSSVTYENWLPEPHSEETLPPSVTQAVCLSEYPK